MRGKELVFLFIVIFNSIVTEVQLARILCVFPLPSKSHFVVFQSYIEALSNNGHELVVITAEHLPFEVDNIKVINIDIIDKIPKVFSKNVENRKRGVIMDLDEMITIDLYNEFLEVIVEGLHQPAVQQLIDDKTQKFDLIVVEAFYEYQLVFSEIFRAPIITFASFSGFPETYEMVGSVGRHPLYYPHFHRRNFEDLSFFGVLNELYKEYKLYKLLDTEKHQDTLLNKNFGRNAPTIRQLKNNVDMLFLSVHPMLANNRPVPPNVVYFHAPHLQPVKDLPQDLKSYLDNSKKGVVYVSFGSSSFAKTMHQEFLDELLKAFAALPFDILWKCEAENLDGVPKNVKTQRWFPQRDLLDHPNVKVFVTQGGIQSMSEAIDAAVPVVGIPLAAEQFYNTHKFEEFKIGVRLNTLTMIAEDLIRGVNTVAEDKSYKENIMRLRDIFRDQAEPSLQRAVWWTEYVIRHGGAKHLRSPAANVTFWEYYMMEYVIFLAGAVISILSVILLSVYCLIKRILRILKNDHVMKKREKKVKKS